MGEGDLSSDGTVQYNTAAIRNLLRDAFTDAGLRRFCQDRATLRFLVTHFGSRFSLEEMIDVAIEECYKRKLLPHLLLAIQEANPRQFERHKTRLHEPNVPSWEAMTHLSLFTVPFPRNRRFVGREADMAELHRLLQEQYGAIGITPVGISGMGGIGKTQLAVEYAYRYRDAYPGGVLWVNAVRVEEWNQELVDLADRLGLLPADPGSPDRTGQMVSALARYLHEYPYSLVVFDNVADPRHLQTVRLGAGITPGRLGGTLLFTTKRREMPSGLNAFDVQVLPRESSREMIIAARSEADSDPHLDQLCAILGDLPLALELAAAALRNRPRLTLSAYLENFALLGADALHAKARVTPDDLATYYAVSLEPALQAQWESLEDEHARFLLRVAGQLGEAQLLPVVRLGLLANLHGDGNSLEDPLRDALHELAAVSLVERLTSDQVRLHPLVRNFAARQTPEEESPMFRQQCAANLATAYEDFVVLEDHCICRGVDALLADLTMALNLLPETRADHHPLSSLQSLLRFLRREAHNLRSWDRQKRPAFLAQQAYNLGVELGMIRLSTCAAIRLEHLHRPCLTLRWCTSQSRALEQTLAGHGGEVNSVTVTPDGRRAISASLDGTLRIWNLGTGQTEHILFGHKGMVLSVTIVPDGRRVISGASDGTLKVWNVETGQEEFKLSGHDGVIYTVATTFNGKHVVSGSGDGTLKVWDLETGQEVRTLAGHNQAVEAVALTPDSQYAVSTSSDGTLKVWDLKTGQEMRTLAGLGGVPWAVTVTPDGKRAITGYDGCYLEVWDIETGQSICKLTRHEDSIRAAAVLPDGRYVISGSDDGTLKMWDLDTKREICTLAGHGAAVNTVTVTPDGKHVISASNDYTLKVWTIASELHGDLSSGQQGSTSSRHRKTVTSIAVTPNGHVAISGSGDGIIKVWDLETGQEIQALSGHFCGGIWAVAVTPDSRRVISGHDGHPLLVWDLETGKQIYRLLGHEGWVTTVAVTTDGRLAVSGSFDGTVKVWDLETGQEVRTLAGHDDLVWAVALTPDDRIAISGSGDGTLKVWDLKTGQEKRILEGHTGPVTAIALTPDGMLAISGSSDTTLRVWDLATGRELRILVGHRDFVQSVAVMQDGKCILSGSRDGTIAVWKLETGEELATAALGNEVRSVAVAPDGDTILAGDATGNVYSFRYTEMGKAGVS